MIFDTVSSRIMREQFGIHTEKGQTVIALAGNPNVGKSTVFNALTGLRQHTGNWPGKTVDNAQGSFYYHDKSFLIVDLPGTYSLIAHTVEEEIARDFICFGKPDVTIVVLDATSLERNLNLALQVMEITSRAVVCVNLIDEARKSDIIIDFAALEKELGVPVVATAARYGQGLGDLKEEVYQVAFDLKVSRPRMIHYSPGVETALETLLPQIEKLGLEKIIDPRWIALRLLDGDQKLLDTIEKHLAMQSLTAEHREVEVAL